MHSPETRAEAARRIALKRQIFAAGITIASDTPTDALQVIAQLAGRLDVLATAAAGIIGNGPDRYGYKAAANAMDDTKRAALRDALHALNATAAAA